MTTTPRLRWVKDEDPRWDDDRERVVATVPAGVLPAGSRRPGDRLPSDWWRVEDGDRVVGYGWLDDVWGDAEILLAVEESARGTGAGAFALARLEDEAAARGLNYVVNVVRDTHPDREAVTGWFLAHGFTGTEDGRLRKQVGGRTRDAGQEQAGPERVRRSCPTTTIRRGTRPSGRRRRRWRAGTARSPQPPTSVRGVRR